MHNLNSIGISDQTIQEIIDNNSRMVVEDLDFKYQKVKEIIEILKKLNVNNINDYLIYKTDIFYKDPEEIVKKISHFDSNELTNLLNEDIDNIDEILN